MGDTVHITGGRTMWRGPGPACVISDGNYGDDLFRLDNAELRVFRERGSEFDIKVRHENGTDIEHDAAYIAVFEGAGLDFSSISGRRVRFTGVLLKAYHYTPGFPLVDGADVSFNHDCPEIYRCTNDSKSCRRSQHLIMPYYPPQQKFKPRLVEFDIDFYDRSGSDDNNPE